jgi:hypothetical protein
MRPERSRRRKPQLVAATCLTLGLAPFAAPAAIAQVEPEGWRTGAFDGQVSAFISAPANDGAFATVVFVSLSCGARPTIRLRGPVARHGADARPRPLSLAFEAGGDVHVLPVSGSFSPIPAARAPDNWSTATDPDRVELVAERAAIEAADIVALREAARFIATASGPTLVVRGADPRFEWTLPLTGAGRAVGRYLSACAGLS